MVRRTGRRFGLLRVRKRPPPDLPRAGIGVPRARRLAVRAGAASEEAARAFCGQADYVAATRVRCFGAAASWPHAASMSRPRVRRTVTGTRAFSSSKRKAAITSRDEPSYRPVGLYGIRLTLKWSRPR